MTFRSSIMLQCIQKQLCDDEPLGSRKPVSIDDEWGCDASGVEMIQRIKLYDDDTTTIEYFAPDGVTPLPLSSTFTPVKPVTPTENKFVTDTVTGAFIEVTEVKDITNGIVTYYDASGVVYVPTATEIVRDYVEEVPLGNEIITVVPGTPATLTLPANARYAYMNINGADAMYAHGAAPVATVDHRVSDGGRIEVQSIDRLASFQLDSLDGATPLSTRVYYYNRNPDVDRS